MVQKNEKVTEFSMDFKLKTSRSCRQLNFCKTCLIQIFNTLTTSTGEHALRASGDREQVHQGSELSINQFEINQIDLYSLQKCRQESGYVNIMSLRV